MQFIGNEKFLSMHKTAFLCSRKCPAHIIMKSYDWAIEQRDKGACVLSGFHSKIEKDVLYYLLKGTQPVILALARGFKKRLEPELKEAMQNNRLLIVTQFNETIKYVTKETASQRNKFMAELADTIFIAYAHQGGSLERLVPEFLETGKPVYTFDVEENRHLLEMGVLGSERLTKP